jgi:hypothetical protein
VDLPSLIATLRAENTRLAWEVAQVKTRLAMQAAALRLLRTPPLAIPQPAGVAEPIESGAEGGVESFSRIRELRPTA